MHFRRNSSSSDDLGLILGVAVPLCAILIVLGLILVRRKLQSTKRIRPKKPAPLPLYKGALDVPGVPESARSYTPTFTFPQSKEHSPIDLKDPFRSPSPTSTLAHIADLPTLPSQAVVLTARRAHAAPPPRKVNVSKSIASITLEDFGSSPTSKAPVDQKDGWGLSYYEEDHPPFSRPPSYQLSPTRTRSHSPLPIPMRSASVRLPRTLSRQPSTPTLSRRLSTPLDITISTEVRVHIDSMYVESHAEDLHKDSNLKPMDHEHAPRITSIVPQIPSMHIPSLYLGTSFDTFGDTLIALDKLEGNRKSQPVTLGSTIEDTQMLLTVPNSPSTSIGVVPDISGDLKPVEKAAFKDTRKPPVGWI